MIEHKTGNGTAVVISFILLTLLFVELLSSNAPQSFVVKVKALIGETNS